MNGEQEMDATTLCFFDDCSEEATTSARSVLGRHRYCALHAALVRQIEAEWDRAEAEMLEQY